jgi:hypothetical protein
VLSDSLFAELKYTGYTADNDRLPKNGDIPSVRILGGDRETFRNAVYERRQELTNDALTASFDLFATTGAINHTFKFGLDYEMGTWLETRRRSGGFTWRPEVDSGVTFNPSDPSTWGFISSDWGSGIRLEAETLNAALYLQDYVDLTSNLRLSAGLRWGRWEGDLKPGFGGGSWFEAVSDDAVDPRLGLVWDVLGDATWAAKAHWGRYHQNLFSLHFDRIAGGNVFEDEEYWDWAYVDDQLPDINHTYTLAEREQYFELYEIVPTSSEVGPALDYTQPYVDQLVVGVEHGLGDSWKIGLTWVNRENKEIVALVDRNLASNYTPYYNVSVVDYSFDDAPVLDQDGNPLVLPVLWVPVEEGFAPDYVLTNPEGATREMDQYQLVLDGRGDKWFLSGSIVYTELEGNFYSVSGYQSASGIGAGMYVNPNEMTNAYGRLVNANEWEAKVRFTYDLPWKVRTGAYLRYGSGEYDTPVYEIDTRNHDFYAENGDYIHYSLLSDVNGEDIFLDTRGSYEYDSFWTLDVHIDKLIPIGSGDLILGFDVFNVFNEDAINLYENRVNIYDDEIGPSASEYGATLRRETPRTARLYASIRW